MILTKVYFPVGDKLEGRSEALKVGSGFVNESGLSRKVSTENHSMIHELIILARRRKRSSQLEAIADGLYRRLAVSSVRLPSFLILSPLTRLDLTMIHLLRRLWVLLIARL